MTISETHERRRFEPGEKHTTQLVTPMKNMLLRQRRCSIELDVWDLPDSSISYRHDVLYGNVTVWTHGPQLDKDVYAGPVQRPWLAIHSTQRHDRETNKHLHFGHKVHSDTTSILPSNTEGRMWRDYITVRRGMGTVAL